MTYEEAKSIIKNRHCNNNEHCRDECMYGKGKCEYDMAFSALEKQIPKKPTRTIHKYRMENTTELGQYTLTHCPSCFENKELGYFESLVDKGTKYCIRCGQALDWSDME